MIMNHRQRIYEDLASYVSVNVAVACLIALDVWLA